MTGLVYLLHLSEPLSPDHTAQHYVGWTRNADTLRRRLGHHRAGSGARFLDVARERGVSSELVAVYRGDRHLERRFKRHGDCPKMCPVCSPGNRRRLGLRDDRTLHRQNPKARRFALDAPATFLAAMNTRHLQRIVRQFDLAALRRTFGHGGTRRANEEAVRSLVFTSRRYWTTHREGPPAWREVQGAVARGAGLTDLFHLNDRPDA
jgi:hypothetical protein